MRKTPRIVTLLNLVTELSAVASEREVVATVTDLVDKRQVTLIGQIRGGDILPLHPGTLEGGVRRETSGVEGVVASAGVHRISRLRRDSGE